jgi:hypothetical protein
MLLVVLRSQLSQWVSLRLAVCEEADDEANNLPKPTEETLNTRRQQCTKYNPVRAVVNEGSWGQDFKEGDHFRCGRRTGHRAISPKEA